MEYREKISAQGADGAQERETEKREAECVMETRNLSFSYDGKVHVLEHLDLRLQKGKITVILGANGCGKSTLFKLLTKNLYPDEGEIALHGENLDEYSLKEFARKVAIVHQNNTAPPDQKVETLVGYGRTPYLNAFQTAGSREDREAVEWAMKVTHVEKYRKRPISELSGGQRQRVWIAMALAMMTDILLLDEPCNSLDIRYQIGIMKLVRQLNREYGMTIIMILHDINQAMAYANVLIGMKDGRIIAEGDPQTIVTPEWIRTVYGIELPVTEIDGRKYVLAV